eukprot:NODE_463_length_8163_cov_0.168279.p1 type:complete len:942 gc:universal NODE_463_length_8163_cov_0.168279:7616-4791(-)
MSTPSSVISKSFDRLATSTSISDKMGSLRTIKSLSSSNSSDIIPHITELFQLLNESNKDLLSIAVECLYNLLIRDKSLVLVYGKYIDSFYPLLLFSHTPVLFHTLSILLLLNPNVLIDNIQSNTISTLLDCINNDVLVHVALNVLLILSTNPPIQYQLLFQGIEPLMDLAWQSIHHEPLLLSPLLSIILNILKHPKGLELIQEVYSTNIYNQFSTCWMGLIHMLVQHEYSLPSKVIQSIHYFEQFAIKEYQLHSNLSSQISSNVSLLTFWMIPHDEWLDWDNVLVLYSKLLLLLKPNKSIYPTIIEIATTWGVPLNSRSFSWQLIKHMNDPALLTLNCRVLSNNQFTDVPVWQHSLFMLNYPNNALLFKIAVTTTLNYYDLEQLVLFIMSPLMESSDKFHPLFLSFINPKDPLYSCVIPNLLWNTKLLDLITNIYNQRTGQSVLNSLLKTLILLPKSTSLLSYCSYWVLLAKWFYSNPMLIFDWFQDPRALNFISESMTSGDLIKQSISSFAFSVALVQLVHVDQKGQSYGMKTLYPLVLNRIGLDQFISKLNRLTSSNIVLDWNNIEDINGINSSSSSICILPEWSVWIESQLVVVIKALKSGPSNVVVPDSPDIINTYKQMVNKQQLEILQLQSDLQVANSNSSSKNTARCKVLEDELNQINRKYSQLQLEQEDLLICLAEQEMEMKQMAELLVSMGIEKYNYILTDDNQIERGYRDPDKDEEQNKPVSEISSENENNNALENTLDKNEQDNHLDEEETYPDYNQEEESVKEEHLREHGYEQNIEDVFEPFDDEYVDDNAEDHQSASRVIEYENSAAEQDAADKHFEHETTVIQKQIVQIPINEDEEHEHQQLIKLAPIDTVKQTEPVISKSGQLTASVTVAASSTDTTPVHNHDWSNLVDKREDDVSKLFTSNSINTAVKKIQSPTKDAVISNSGFMI